MNFYYWGTPPILHVKVSFLVLRVLLKVIYLSCVIIKTFPLVYG